MTTAGVIFVPGTHGRDCPTDWFSPNSAFVGMLDRFGMGLSNPQRPFEWSTRLNGPKHWDWEAGGINLFAYIAPPLFPDARITSENTRIVCHSHGLQVVLYACASGLKVGSLVSVGSPVREDMMEIAGKARPNINRWLHLSNNGDWWQALGELFDGHLGIRREHPLADRNDKTPRDSGHAGVLRDQRLFPLWQTNGWAAWLKNTKTPIGTLPLLMQHLSRLPILLPRLPASYTSRWRLHVAARVLRLQREWDTTDRARARADTAVKAAMRDAAIVSKIAVVADKADGNKQ